MVIGTSWGTTLANTVEHLSESATPLQVVQLMGSVPCSSPSYTPQGVVANMASALKCHGSFLNMPLFIEDDYVRASMRQDKNNQKY